MIIKDLLMPRGSINVFTDASIKKINGITYSSSGIQIRDFEDRIICSKCQIIRNSTNNIGETFAVLMGIDIAREILLSNKDKYNSINVFSDSSFVITGLTDWLIHSWIYNKRDGKVYNSSNQLVANQQIFSSIVHSILSIDKNIPVRLWKQRGHMNINNPSHMGIAKNYFESANNMYLLSSTVHPYIIQYISEINNIVDYFSRDIFSQFNDNEFIKFPTIVDLLPVTFSIPDINEILISYVQRITQPINF